MRQASKCFNYVGLQHTSEVSFVALLLVWTFVFLPSLRAPQLVLNCFDNTQLYATVRLTFCLKHQNQVELITRRPSYLNCVILWSVWYEFDLIPEFYRTWTSTPGAPASGLGSWWLFTALSTGRIPAWIQSVPHFSLLRPHP